MSEAITDLHAAERRRLRAEAEEARAEHTAGVSRRLVQVYPEDLLRLLDAADAHAERLAGKRSER